MLAMFLGSALLLFGLWTSLDELQLQSAPHSPEERETSAAAMHAAWWMATGGGLAFAGLMVFVVLCLNRRPAVPAAIPKPLARVEY